MNTSEMSIVELVRDLYPLSRSITGNGVRKTFELLQRVLPLAVHEVPTGARALDWEVPVEWNLHDAWIENSAGERIVDVADSNLHVVSYSDPVDLTLRLDELMPHLHTDPKHPDAIPYRTTYYSPGWGFCLSHRQLESLPGGNYRVLIDASKKAGSLSYAEALIPGETEDTCLVFTHTCHPSLFNDNLSGIVVSAFLGQWLSRRNNRYTYRLVFAPGTIGSLAWLDRNEQQLHLIKSGLVLGLLGVGSQFLYKRSRTGRAEIDMAVESWIQVESPASTAVDYSPWGYDERQFGSPGIALPIGRLTRVAEEGYPEYHNSADDLSLMDERALTDALASTQQIIEILDSNGWYRNLSPRGEPQLGRRGLYRGTGGDVAEPLQRAVLAVLSFSDGDHDLIEIYRKTKLPFATILQARDLLLDTSLLEACR